VEIDLSDIGGNYRELTLNRHSRHAATDRLQPSLFQYDYLALSTLSADVRRLLKEVPPPTQAESGIALDIGCGRSPYRVLAESRGFHLKTLDISADTAPDFVGTVEHTGLPDGFADLVLCTQVLEHSLDPERGLRDIHRILRPGGHLIVTVPHVWFYHPHPNDNWRFTQEGLARIALRTGFEPRLLLSQGGSALSLFQIGNFLLYGAIGKLGAPAYLVGNVIGLLADRLVSNTLFCLNFALLARKPATGEIAR
jgi:SAM-dependent methyltransferase